VRHQPDSRTPLINEMMNPRALAEMKTRDANLLRERIGFAAQRLMEPEIERGRDRASWGTRPAEPTQRLSRPRLRAAHPQALRKGLAASWPKGGLTSSPPGLSPSGTGAGLGRDDDSYTELAR
jgi:hypothetical protein